MWVTLTIKTRDFKIMIIELFDLRQGEARVCCAALCSCVISVSCSSLALVRYVLNLAEQLLGYAYQ